MFPDIPAPSSFPLHVTTHPVLTYIQQTPSGEIHALDQNALVNSDGSLNPTPWTSGIHASQENRHALFQSFHPNQPATPYNGEEYKLIVTTGSTMNAFIREFEPVRERLKNRIGTHQ